MIENKKGNLLNAEDCKAIIHQVNCIALMGAGIAKQIKEKWFNEVFVPYRKACTNTENKKELLGKIQVLKTTEKPIEYVINVFGQYSVGKNDAPFPNGRQTDYEALYQCLKKIKMWCKKEGVLTIGMPKNLGCGLAGGDWNGVVYPMIDKVFGEDNDIILNIYEYFS